MSVAVLSRRVLLHEARALLARLARVRPFALNMPMVPAAAISVAAQGAIERHMQKIKRRLARLIRTFMDWLAQLPLGSFRPHVAQERFTILRMQFNALITQFDIFGDVISQRSEHGTGVWVAGLDSVAADALRVPGLTASLPPIICYLDRGHGAAIRRVRTKLPGGDAAPLAVINLPRERMVGSGVASSLVHEVGHQAAANLKLVESLRPELVRMQQQVEPPWRNAWVAWERWISEIVADFWSVGKIGVGSTIGLLAVVSLPRPFVFRLDLEDPHPFPWIRVKTSCAMGNALYPHPQWDRLERVWESLYPLAGLTPPMREWISRLEATLPQFVKLLTEHRPAALGGRLLRDIMPLTERTPQRLAAILDQYRQAPSRLAELPPTLAFAVIGQARVNGKLPPDIEGRLLGDLLETWALQSALRPARHERIADARPSSRLTMTAAGKFAGARA